MIDEGKLLSELIDMGESVENHIIDADNNGEKTLDFMYKNQLAMLKNVIRRIRNQPKIGEWIPCSKRMPETDIPVLCQWHKRNGLGTEVFFSILCVDENGIWSGENGTLNGEVVAWQPLPEPYKVGYNACIDEISGENDGSEMAAEIMQMKTVAERRKGLKPCPFCGATAEVKNKNKGGGRVIWCECMKCHTKTKGYRLDLHDEGLSVDDIELFINLAIKEWNIRF